MNAGIDLWKLFSGFVLNSEFTAFFIKLVSVQFLVGQRWLTTINQTVNKACDWPEDSFNVGSEQFDYCLWWHLVEHVFHINRNTVNLTTMFSCQAFGSVHFKSTETASGIFKGVFLGLASSVTPCFLAT